MKKLLKVLCFLINIAGIACLAYFAYPYIAHITDTVNSDAMIPFQRWEASGTILTIGFAPLLLSNLAAFLMLRKIKGIIRFIVFVPAAVCLVLALSYWLPALA